VAGVSYRSELAIVKIQLTAHLIHNCFLDEPADLGL
jgi:hypothetical protein